MIIAGVGHVLMAITSCKNYNKNNEPQFQNLSEVLSPIQIFLGKHGPRPL